MSASVRKPKPRKTPSTLLELVLDLDDRLEGGDALSDVWLPHEDWARLVETAQDESHAAVEEVAHEAALGESISAAARRVDVLEAALERWRGELVQALGAGSDTELPDLVEIARGYAMALDAERQAVLDRAEKVVAEARAKKSKRPAGPGPANSGGVTHMGCSACLSAPFVVRIGEEERPVHYADRDTAAEYSLKVGLTAFEIWEPRKNLRWDVYAKCESCGEVTDGHVTSSCPKAKAGEGPGRLRCPRCLGPCLNEGDRCVRSAGATRLKELRQLTPEHRSDLAIDHPEWFCERGRARGCALQADHAGDCMMFSELEAFEGPEEPEAEHPECPHCGEADGHKPSECAMNVDSDAALAADSGRRLNGAGWKREAKKARETNALDTCHHCGVGEDFGDDLLAVRSDEVLPDGVFCRGCRVRLTKNPAEWERHGPPAPTMVEKLEADEKAAAEAKAKKSKQKGQTTLDEAIAATTPHREVHRAPGRATKKFPLGARDLAEKCTACGAELGAHAGTKCPPKNRRRLRIEDVPAEVA